MRPTLFPLLIPLLALACGDKDDAVTPADDTGDVELPDDSPVNNDLDLDGYTESDGDCDDSNAAIYPGRAEDCDGVDNNCNGQTDESFPDSDDDLTPDCMDTEECDGVDNDGDGSADEDFTDTDGNGVADCASTELCDGIDNDGDGEVDEDFDLDGDGYISCGDDADCDDADASIYPGATESPGNGVDESCDGLVDEGEWVEGDLVITELMINPDVITDPNGEWFELYNNSGRTVYLNGLTILSDGEGETHTIQSASLITLEPGALFVLGLVADSSRNGGVDLDYVYSAVSLSNESDSLTLKADGLVLDVVRWDDGATMPDPVAASVSLDPGSWTASANDSASAWCVASSPWGADTEDGSPGKVNASCK